MTAVPRLRAVSVALPLLAGALLLVPPGTDAEQLGRLFTTPEERAALNELRRERDLIAPGPQVETDPLPDATAVEQLSIDGLVIRSGGPSSAWINGRPVVAGERSREGVRVDTSASRGGRVKITLPSGIDTVELKPGQKIDVESGLVAEAYESGSVPGGPSVFDDVSPQGITSPGAESDRSPANPGAAPEAGEAVKRPGGVQYPEVFLERIRRALEGAKE